nr:DUF2953 domain-containing protein [uncultured Oscillibacter sp.]
MVWRWVLGILALLILLLCRTRAGVLVTLGDALRVDVKLGWFRFQVVPGRERQKKPPKKKDETARDGGEEEKKSPSKPSLEEIRDAVRTLLPPLKRALARTRRGIRVEPLRLSLILGGREDPAAAAKLYGELNAAVWTGMPQLERLLDIPDPRIHIEVDFDAEESRTEGSVGAAIRIGTALAVGFGIGIPALRWLLHYMRRHRKEEKQRPAPAASGTA